MAATRVARADPTTALAIPAMGVPVLRVRLRAARRLPQAAHTEAARPAARPVSAADADPLRAAGDRPTVPLRRVGSRRQFADQPPSAGSPADSLAPAEVPTDIRPRQPAAFDQETRREIHGGTVLSTGAVHTLRRTGAVAGRSAALVAERLPEGRSAGGAAGATLPCRGIDSRQAAARCRAECARNRGGR